MASSPKDPKQQKTKPIRRNDVIHCENCGEDYSVTYKRCPFCDERPAKNGRPRTAGGRRVAGGGRSGRPANPLQVAALVGSLVLIIVAMYIVFTSLAPLFSKGEDDPGGSQADPGASTSQTGPDASSTPSGSQGDISQPEPEPPVTVDVTSLTLDKSDFTLQAGESATIQAAVVPADAEITWSSSDPEVVSVDENGKVSHGSKQGSATITATMAGGVTQTCLVHNSVTSGASSSSGSGSGASGALSLNRTDFTLEAGQAFQVKVSGTSSTPTWSIGNTAVATVAGDGTVMHVGKGQTTLTCTVDGKTLTCIVRCN